jgi:hypothetical protein
MFSYQDWYVILCALSMLQLKYPYIYLLRDLGIITISVADKHLNDITFVSFLFMRMLPSIYTYMECDLSSSVDLTNFK